jgi:hypothetical protein
MDNEDLENNKMNVFTRALLITLLIAVLKSILAFVFGFPSGLVYFLSDFLAAFLVVGVLTFYVSGSVLRGSRLLLAVFAIYCVIGNINIHIEALIFNVTDTSETVFLAFVGVISMLIESAIIVALIGIKDGSFEQKSFKQRSVPGWIGRIAAGVFIYFVIYLAAGMLLVTAYPELTEFYGDKLPPFSLMAITQVVRGLIFVGIAILILRTTAMTTARKALLIGLVFSILGGIAPLIPPNEFMPADIRIGHGFEVGVSNLIYGVILGYLLGRFKDE